MPKLDILAQIHRLSPEEITFFENRVAEIDFIVQKINDKIEEITTVSRLVGEWELCEDLKWIRRKES